MFFKVPRSSAWDAFWDEFGTVFSTSLEHFGSRKLIIFGDFFQHGRGWHFEGILGAFWEHFGGPLATFWVPLGSVGTPLVPFVVPFAPWWDSLRSLRPLLVAFGLLFVRSIFQRV